MATDKKDYMAAEKVKNLQAQGYSERDAILVSMKNTKKEQKKSSGAMVSSDSNGDPHPYGLTLSLEDDSLTKLGIDTLPKVGATVEVRGRAKVESVSQNESGTSGVSRSVRLQITDMCLEDANEDSEGDDEDDDEDEEAGE